MRRDELGVVNLTDGGDTNSTTPHCNNPSWQAVVSRVFLLLPGASGLSQLDSEKVPWKNHA